MAVEGEEDQEEDGEGIQTERLEFVANGFEYSVQTTNRAEVGGRWKGSPEVNPTLKGKIPNIISKFILHYFRFT